MRMKCVCLSVLVALATCSVWGQNVKLIEGPKRVIINNKGDKYVKKEIVSLYC